MPEGNHSSLVNVNLGDLSKVAEALVNRASDAVGGFCKPWQIRRTAKAEADAAKTHAICQIEIDELQERALMRTIYEETQRQVNIESITAQAIPHLNENADPTAIDNDWLVNFFDKSRIISDKEMQSLWAQILAGEANDKGTFSRRTINKLNDLEKKDAELFTNLCRFKFDIHYSFPLIFNYNAQIYNEFDINFDNLLHLDSLGLIKFESLAHFTEDDLPESFSGNYYGHKLDLKLRNKNEFYLETGEVLFTQVGKELATICKTEPVNGFLDYIHKQWKKYL